MSHNHWTSYWQSGAISSFGNTLPAWYKELLEPFWTSIFTCLPENARILDIATGNGTIARLASKISSEQSKSFTIIATDKSQQSKSAVFKVGDKKHQNDEIHFLFGQPVEKLKLPGEKFDLITSQFGIEYSNTGQSLKSLSSLLSPGAEIQLIMHHAESVLCQQSRKELEQYRAIFNESQYFKKLKSLIISMGEQTSSKSLEALKANKRAQQERERFNRLVSRLIHQFNSASVIADLLNRTNQLFRVLQFSPVEEKLSYITTLNHEMHDAQLRLHDMLSAAMTKQSLEKFQSCAETSSLEIQQSSTLKDPSGNLLAINLRLKHI